MVRISVEGEINNHPNVCPGVDVVIRWLEEGYNHTLSPTSKCTPGAMTRIPGLDSRSIISKILAQVWRDMQHPAGGFTICDGIVILHGSLCFC